MVEFLRNHQLNIMLALGSVCLIIALFVLVTRTLSTRRKKVLLLLEISAAILLYADRFAYIYRGDVSTLGYYMVRICNYLVFASTLMVVHSVNLYLADFVTHEGGLEAIPVRLRIASLAVVVGQILLIISQFTGIYYTFDETNHYQRASLYVVCYVVPLLILFIHLSVTVQYYGRFGKGVRAALILFSIVPGIVSVMQFFLYGLSLTNISMTGMAIVLYIFVLNDANEMVERAHQIELGNVQGERARLQRLFDQTARAFVSAVEKKDEFAKGNSVKVAEYAERIAKANGKNEDECRRVYYAALLHDVGLIGIPDDIIKSDRYPGNAAYEVMRQRPVIGHEILSNITEYPYLREGAYYSHERYNGTGYPEGLKGEEIPEIARMIAVADAYVTMTTKKRYREAKPIFMAREALVKGGGEEFDPKFAETLIKIIDADVNDKAAAGTGEVEKTVRCKKYRERISTGIPIEHEITRVTFECGELRSDGDDGFSAPAIILFDSYDGRVHGSERTIEAYKYLEYGEVWFDEHSVCTEARKIQETVKRRDGASQSAPNSPAYEILTGRFEDHLKLRMISPSFEKEVIVALPSGSKSAYVAITGENCEIKDISVGRTGREVGQDDIPRIVDVTSYIDRMESDIKNVQIDRTRSAYTEGMEIKDRLKVNFHTMSLPEADLVWQCPYVVLFYSEDGKVGGKDYREYALVKLYGESDGDKEFARNGITVKKTEDFPGWDAWKEINKGGLECELTLRKVAKRIFLKTRNLGIEMENVTTIIDDANKVYLALTGDQIAITDIRIK